MGQRTAFLIKKNYREYNEDKTSYREVCEISLLHHQWGIGKVTPMLFLDQLIEANYSCNRRKELDFDKNRLLDEFTFEPLDPEPYIDREKHYKDVDDVDVWDTDTRVKLFDMTDNNNGGMVIELTQLYNDYGSPKTYGNYYTGKIGFVLGNEETDEPFEKIVNAKTFMNKTWHDKKGNNKFLKAFLILCEMFDIEEYKVDSKKEVVAE